MFNKKLLCYLQIYQESQNVKAVKRFQHNWEILRVTKQKAGSMLRKNLITLSRVSMGMILIKREMMRGITRKVYICAQYFWQFYVRGVWIKFQVPKMHSSIISYSFSIHMKNERNKGIHLWKKSQKRKFT